MSSSQIPPSNTSVKKNSLSPINHPKRRKSTVNTKEDEKTNSSNVLSSGFLLTCDRPCKEFIKHLDASKSADKKIIIEDLDPTHLLVKGVSIEEILESVEQWNDEVCRKCYMYCCL